MPEWIPLVIATAFLGLLGICWAMLNAKIDRERDAIWDQIGRSTQEGMRKTVHDSANAAQIVESLADRVERLETWRNGKL